MTKITHEQLQILAEKIEQQKVTLVEDIRDRVREQEETRANELDNQLNDSGDYSVADILMDMQLEYLDRETEWLHKLERAQSRMSLGQYGACVDCDADIGYDRLAIAPEAERCIDCQRAHEHQYHTREMGH